MQFFSKPTREYSLAELRRLGLPIPWHKLHQNQVPPVDQKGNKEHDR